MIGKWIELQPLLTKRHQIGDDDWTPHTTKTGIVLKATPLDALLKNERAIVIAGMVGLALAYTVAGVGMKFSAVQMTGLGAAMMAHAQWTMGYGVLVVLM